jgi:hypothetical protein
VDQLQRPLPDALWMTPTTADWLLVAQPQAFLGLRRGCFVLWNPLTGAIQTVDGEAPPGSTIAVDHGQNQLHITTNDNISGVSAGFDWSMNDTHYGVWDLKARRFARHFHGVEETDARHLIVQNRKETLVFGYGRASHFIDLMRRDFSHVDRNTHDFSFNLSHLYGAQCLGADSQRALLVFGNDGNSAPKEAALMRWTRAQGRFETIGRWIGIFCSCSTNLSDGSTLIFCSQYQGNTVRIIRHIPGQQATCIGRLEGEPVYHAIQGSDGRIYAKGGKTLNIITPPPKA